MMGDTGSADALRNKLFALVQKHNVGFGRELNVDTPLIESGALDSLGLFNLALFVEGEIGHEVDITTIDISKEWNTISNVMRFIAGARA